MGYDGLGCDGLYLSRLAGVNGYKLQMGCVWWSLLVGRACLWRAEGGVRGAGRRKGFPHPPLD